MRASQPVPHLLSEPCVAGVPKSTEIAVKFQFRTKDDEKVKAHRNTLINRTIRGKKKRARGDSNTRPADS